jgi:DNA-binding transcriptional MerR regulator
MATASQSVVLAGFTDDQAIRLAGVSGAQLRYWAREKFFVPSIEVPVSEGMPPVRLYSFRDLVCLKIINSLRNEANIPLQHLRVVKDKLAHLGEDMWANTTLYVLRRRVVFHNPETGELEDVASGQGLLQIPLVVVSGNMEEAVKALRQRPEAQHGRIDTKRSGPKNPVLAGTRIPVRSIKEFADAGYTLEKIREQYPSLTDADIRAAIEYKIAA